MNLNRSAIHNKKGFTLVEVMIVVVIIGLLATMAIPAFKRIQLNSKAARFVSDARQFAGAIENYSIAEGDFPTDGGSGVLPAELRDYIKPSDFEEGSPLGGNWDIETNDSGVTCAVGAVDISSSNDDLVFIDAKNDDGTTNGGRYQSIRAGGYYLIIEP